MPIDHKLIEGVRRGIAVACTDTRDGISWIELLDDDHETTLGSLPDGTEVETINEVFRMLTNAAERGEAAGRRAMRAQILDLLGVTDPVKHTLSAEAGEKIRRS